MDFLNKHYNVELLEEDYGINGLDYIKTLTVEELEDEFGDYKKKCIVSYEQNRKNTVVKRYLYKRVCA